MADKSKMMHVASVTLGFLEACGYLNSHMVTEDFVEHGLNDSQSASFVGITNLGHQSCLRRSHRGIWQLAFESFQS